MLEFYFPKLKAKKMAEPMTGKAYRARGGSIRYGLQAQHEGSMSLPKYVPVSEYESLGFNAEEAVAALPAYEPKPAPVPADPTLDIPSESPEPAEPTNANFSAESPKTRTFVVSSVDYETDDEDQDELGLPQDFTFVLDIDDIGDTTDMQEIADEIVENISDETGFLVSGFYFQELLPDGTLVDLDAESFGADFEATSGSGTIDHDRIDREEDVSVIMRHDSPFTDYDWDSHIDLSEEEEDELEDAIRQEVGGEPDEDDRDYYINVDTADGNHDVYVQTHTDYGSGRFYDFASESIHQFNGESSSCCGEPIYRYKSEGDWLCMACDFMQAEFTPEELTESSAIHGDFDHASINYSGHQNLVAQAETVMKDGVYRTTCDCGTVLTWDVGMFNAKDKDGNIIKSPPLEVERLEFPSRQFDHFEEELSIKCPTCGEYHICEIEAPVYHDSLEVNFGAETQESLIEEPDFIPEGDGRALGQQNSSINLSPLHAETYKHGCSECGKDFGDYEDDFRDCDLCGVLLCGDCNRRCEGCSNTVCDSCRDDSYCNECHEQELEESYDSESLSRNAKMALGFTAIGLGIAFWKGKDLMTLWDSVKEKLKD